jgi:NAD(P)-dependent dehydrogenase (short-subunit alcohol dehydrogenase family)
MISAMSGDAGAKKALLEVQPFHRLGEASEIANTVVFLCSDDANGISGAEISVDGALSAQLKV